MTFYQTPLIVVMDELVYKERENSAILRYKTYTRGFIHEQFYLVAFEKLEVRCYENRGFSQYR